MPVRGSAFVGVRVPGAAAQNSHFAGGRPAWILLGALRIRLYRVVIVAPLPDVSVHVVKAPEIGPQLSDGMRRATGIHLAPGVNRQFSLGVSEAILRLIAR